MQGDMEVRLVGLKKSWASMMIELEARMRLEPLQMEVLVAHIRKVGCISEPLFQYPLVHLFYHTPLECCMWLLSLVFCLSAVFSCL
jgi:hypothetical protein